MLPAALHDFSAPLVGEQLVFEYPLLREPVFRTEFDGGNVKYSVNGGAYEQVPDSAWLYNAPGGHLESAAGGNTNPMAGETAFTGTDGGQPTGSWGTSVIDLAELAATGDKVSFRFDFGMDGCNGIDGWYVDNVTLSICAKPVTPPKPSPATVAKTGTSVKGVVKIRVKVASGDTPGADMGPVITAAAKARIEGLITSGEQQGATVVVDGRGFVVPGCEGGFFVGPTVLDHVAPEQDVYREEVFGPVLDVVRVKDLAEAVAVINANPYGNGTAIFTGSGEAARTFARRVTVGMVGVNVPIPVPVAWHSFGGWKASLFGESHVYGPEGVRFYTRGKVVTQRWPHRDRPTSASFHFSSDAQK